MSLLALVFATLIWTARRLTWPRVAATTAACLCFAATRDAQVWTVAFLALAVGVGAVAGRRQEPSPAIRAGALSVCLVGVVVLTGWGTVSSHRTQQNVADVLYVRVFPYPGPGGLVRRPRDARTGPDRCPGRGRPHTAPGEAKVVRLSDSDPAFARLERWIRLQGHRHLSPLAGHPSRLRGHRAAGPAGAVVRLRQREPHRTTPHPPIVWLHH